MNRKMKTAATVAFMCVVGLLTGCSQNAGPEGVHSTAWYAKNTAARHKERDWCKRIPVKDALSVKWQESPAGVACCEAGNGSKAEQYNIKHGYVTAGQDKCHS